MADAAVFQKRCIVKSELKNESETVSRKYLEVYCIERISSQFTPLLCAETGITTDTVAWKKADNSII